MWLLSLLACLGGGARHEVDRADLAPLGAGELALLSDEEHALQVALTMLEGAKAEAERAEERLDSARALRVQARLEHDSAAAALEAARASRDLYRIGAAEGAEAAKRRELDGADARVAWQEAARRAAESAIELGELRVDLREAELELARYEVLAAAGRSTGYRRSDFTDRVDGIREAYDEAEREHEERVEEATNAWEEWRERDARPEGWNPGG